MTKQAGEQMSLFDRDTWFGKTSSEHSPRTEAKTSGASSKRRRGSSSRPPLFLDLTESGLRAGASWETDGLSLGEYTTRSFGEYPSEENVSLLSQILEEEVPQKYYLSEKACQGILNRAEKRGKGLPQILRDALLNQIRRGNCDAQNTGGVERLTAPEKERGKEL